MNFNIKIFLLCPVPENQKPINEYMILKESSILNWITFSKEKYQSTLFIFYLLSFFIISTFQIFGVIQTTSTFFLFYWLLNNLLETTSFFVFLLIICFFRWKEVKNRFNQSRLIYEEASWYDGQIWDKPFLLIKNDRLLTSQKIFPINQRIIRTLFSFLALLLFFVQLRFF